MAACDPFRSRAPGRGAPRKWTGEGQAFVERGGKVRSRTPFVKFRRQPRVASPRGRPPGGKPRTVRARARCPPKRHHRKQLHASSPGARRRDPRRSAPSWCSRSPTMSVRGRPIVLQTDTPHAPPAHASDRKRTPGCRLAYDPCRPRREANGRETNRCPPTSRSHRTSVLSYFRTSPAPARFWHLARLLDSVRDAGYLPAPPNDRSNGDGVQPPSRRAARALPGTRPRTRTPHRKRRGTWPATPTKS